MTPARNARAINFTSRYERAADRSNDRYVRFALFVWESAAFSPLATIRTLIRHTHRVTHRPPLSSRAVPIGGARAGVEGGPCSPVNDWLTRF